MKWAKAAAGADSGRRALRQRRVDLRRPAHGQAREARKQRGPRPRPARVRGQAPGLRLVDGLRARRDAHPGRTCRRHGAAPCPKTRSAVIAPEELLAKRWPDLDLNDKRRPSARSAAGNGRGSRGRGARREGRDQLRGRRGQAGAAPRWCWPPATASPAATGAAAIRCRAPVLGGEGTGMERDYEWSSAVHFEDLDGAGQGRPQRRQVRRPPPQSAQGARARACRWSTTAASRAG